MKNADIEACFPVHNTWEEWHVCLWFFRILECYIQARTSLRTPLSVSCWKDVNVTFIWWKFTVCVQMCVDVTEVCLYCVFSRRQRVIVWTCFRRWMWSVRDVLKLSQMELQRFCLWMESELRWCGQQTRTHLHRYFYSLKLNFYCNFLSNLAYFAKTP